MAEPRTEAGDDAVAGLEPWLIELLACPVDWGAVELDNNELVCGRCGRRYPVLAGIPNMLPDDGKYEHKF